jgi:hypothetical protein
MAVLQLLAQTSDSGDYRTLDRNRQCLYGTRHCATVCQHNWLACLAATALTAAVLASKALQWKLCVGLPAAPCTTDALSQLDVIATFGVAAVYEGRASIIQNTARQQGKLWQQQEQQGLTALGCCRPVAAETALSRLYSLM